MSIVYTSGTSGQPKGAMLTYGAFTWSAQQLINHIGIEENDRLFSYLPLAHITERVYIFGSSIIGGVLTAFPESLDTFIEDVKMHRPTCSFLYLVYGHCSNNASKINCRRKS